METRGAKRSTETSMKINDSNSSSVNTSRLDHASAVETSQQIRERKAQSGSESGDRAEISALSGHLHKLATQSPDRAARVEQLSADYRAGNYQVDSHAVSQAMVRDAVARGASAGGNE